MARIENRPRYVVTVKGRPDLTIEVEQPSCSASVNRVCGWRIGQLFGRRRKPNVELAC
ncbi:MAG: hypothetical protein JWL65_4477 [Gammaproteobacteria bacterium]|nr:hypothetical protein [Gammaproteobacteria bacterium]